MRKDGAARVRERALDAFDMNLRSAARRSTSASVALALARDAQGGALRAVVPGRRAFGPPPHPMA